MLRVAGDLDTHIKFYHEVRHVTLNLNKVGVQYQQAHVHSIVCPPMDAGTSFGRTVVILRVAFGASW